MSEELKAKLVGVRRVIHELRLSMQVFRDYGYQHQDKAESADDPKERAERERKAKRNFDRAAACEDALDFFAASRTPTEAEPGEEEVEREPWRVLDEFAADEHDSIATTLEELRGRLGDSDILVWNALTGSITFHRVEANRRRAALRSTTPASDVSACSKGSCQRHGKCMYLNHPQCPLAPAVAVDDALAMLRRRRADADSQGGQAEIDALEIDEAIALVQSLLASVRVKDEANALTYSVHHNPNCPEPFLVRLPRGALDLKKYADTNDALGFGKTFDEAFAKARAALSDQQVDTLTRQAHD